MGSKGACTIAQSFSESCCAAAALPFARRVHSMNPTPHAGPVWGMTIDDFWSLGVGGEDDETLASWSAQIEEVWAKWSVPEHVKKRISLSPHAEVLGQLCSGSRVGPSGTKMIRSMLALLYVCGQRRPLRQSCRRALGKAVSNALMRRCTMSVFGRRSFDCYAPGSVRMSWSEEARQEFLLAATLTPFMHLDLSRGFDSTVRAADSSSRGVGGVQTKVSASVVQDILRTAPKLRGAPDGFIAPGDGADADQPMVLAQKFFWTETLCSRAKTASGRYAVHINVTEMLASRLMAEQASRNLSSLHTRSAILTDSKVVAACISKGRSSSGLLNRELRRICALSLAASIDFFAPWISSAANAAADWSSRRPVHAVPWWKRTHRAAVCGGLRVPRVQRHTHDRFRACRVGEAKRPGPRRGSATSRSVSSSADSALRRVLGRSVQPKTRERYQRALSAFHLWRRAHSRRSWSSCSARRKDKLVARYLAHLVEDSDGPGYSAGSNLYSACRLYYDLPMPVTRRVLKVWKRESRVREALPLSDVHLRLMLGYCLQHKWYQFGLGLVLGYGGLLRVGEFLSLKYRDVKCTADGVVVILDSSKTFQSRSEAIVVRAPWDAYVKEFLRLETGRCPPRLRRRRASAFLLKMSYAKFAGRLRRLVKHVLRINDPDHMIRSHSLRRGGATALYRACRDTGTVAVAGRWASVNSLRRYLREGHALLLRMEDDVLSASQAAFLAVSRAVEVGAPTDQ